MSVNRSVDSTNKSFNRSDDLTGRLSVSAKENVDNNVGENLEGVEDVNVGQDILEGVLPPIAEENFGETDVPQSVETGIETFIRDAEENFREIDVPQNVETGMDTFIRDVEENLGETDILDGERGVVASNVVEAGVQGLQPDNDVDTEDGMLSLDEAEARVKRSCGQGRSCFFSDGMTVL